MKVVVFNKNTRKGFFNTYGYGKLRHLTSCKIIEELNGRYEVELKVDLRDSKVKYLTKWAILSVEGQLFRIFNTVVNDKDNLLTVYARHIFYDLDFGFTIDKKADKKSMAEALAIALPEGLESFTPSSDINVKNTIYFVKDNGVTSIFRAIERWGVGELVRDNFKYAVNQSKGRDNGVTFTYKKLEAIEVTNTTDDIITRLYPTGFDGIALPEKYIVIPNWNEEDYLPYHITKEVYFENATTETQLRLEATREAESLGLSRTNFKIKVNDLLFTELYKEVPGLMSVEVGDIVTIKHEKLDIRTKVKVIKKEIDIVTKACTIELGQPLDNFFKSVDNNNVSVDIPAIESLKSGLYYFTNANSDTKIVDDYQSIAYIQYGTEEDSHLMLYYTMNVESATSGVVDFKIRIDNTHMTFAPSHVIPKGRSLVTFVYPLLYMERNKAHSLHIEARFLSDDLGGDVTIPKNHLQVMIYGQNLSSGMSSSSPHAEVIEEFVPHNHGMVSTVTSTNIQLIKPTPCRAEESFSINRKPLNNLKGMVSIKLTPISYDLSLDVDVVSKNFVYNDNIMRITSEGITVREVYEVNAVYNSESPRHYSFSIDNSELRDIKEVTYE